MIFQAPILAILFADLLVAGFLVYTGVFALRVIAHWDLGRADPRQLALERQTALVSTLSRFVLLLATATLILFTFNADRMASLFTGAMCAVGTLNMNAFGFPALFARIGLFFFAAVWLSLDRLDRAAPDYPLTRYKYRLALGLPLVALLVLGLDLAYFLNLDADTITSCCSRLYAPSAEGLISEMAALDEATALWLLGTVLAATLATALWHRWRGRGAALYAIFSALSFVAGLTAIVSTLSLFIYEHPNHHCPFCMVQAEYGYVGYLLYVPLFAATALGIAPVFAAPFAGVESLKTRLPRHMRQLIGISAILFALFALVAVWIVWRSNLILF